MCAGLTIPIRAVSISIVRAIAVASAYPSIPFASNVDKNITILIDIFYTIWYTENRLAGAKACGASHGLSLIHISSAASCKLVSYSAFSFIYSVLSSRPWLLYRISFGQTKRFTGSSFFGRDFHERRRLPCSPHPGVKSIPNGRSSCACLLYTSRCV